MIVLDGLRQSTTRAAGQWQVLCWGACVTCVLTMIGCAKVEPRPDYARTRLMIADRTGGAEAYDPEADEMIDARVSDLLADGLSASDAVRIALLNNKGFQSLFRAIGVSRAEVVQSGLLTNPSLSFQARFPEGGGRSNLTLGFAQELVDLWQIPVRRKIAETKLEETVLEVVRQAVNLAAEARVKFYRLAALKRSESIARENLALVERSLKLAQDRYAAGETGQLDVFLVRGTLLEVKLELIGLERDRRVAQSELARALGLSRWKSPWEPADGLAAPPLMAFELVPLVLYAMEERLDAKVSALRVQAAEDDLRREYLAIVSSVSLGVEGERLERRALPGRKILADTARASARAGALTAPEIETRGQRNLERRQIIDSLLGPSLSITLPLWDQNQARIAQAALRVQQLRRAYEDLLDQVAQDVQAAGSVLKTAQEMVTFYEKETLPQAQQNVDAALRAYRAGEQNIVALIEAQRSLIVQRQAYVNVVRDCAVAAAELERAVGGRLPPTTTSAPAAEATTQPGGS